MTHPAIAQLFDLSGKTAIVTGAAQGIGLSIAQRLAQAGASVVLAGHNEKALAANAAALTVDGAKAVSICADTGNIDEHEGIVNTALTHFGRIDILVNSVGRSGPFIPFLNVTEEIWQSSIATNFKGTYFLSQRCVAQMMKQGDGGRIINIASTAGIKPDPMLAHYNSAKAAVIQFSRSLAEEFGKHAILVNTVAPGPTWTPNTAAIYAVKEIQDIIAARVPMGRTGEADDVGNAALFLASPAAKFITGATLVVDGGFTVA
jgi:2-dehydro-3-deoxy-D-gluconate 5-dehydrogenase